MLLLSPGINALAAPGGAESCSQVMLSSPLGAKSTGSSKKFVEELKRNIESSDANESWILEDMNAELGVAAFPLIQLSYQEIGLPIQDVGEMKAYDFVLASKSKVDGKLKSVVLFKNSAYGAKLALLGSDGSREGKRNLKAVLAQISNFQGLYAEVSMGAARAAYLGENVVTTPFDVARTVLQGKNIRRPTEEEIIEAVNENHTPVHPQVFWNSYVRNIVINGVSTPVLKIMIGQPILPASQMRSQPVQPWEFDK